MTPPDQSRGRGALRSSPGDRPTLTERRAAAAERRRAAQRRRRTAAAIFIIVVAAAGVGAYVALTHKARPHTAGGGDGGHGSTSTSLVPGSYNVGVTVENWTDPSRTTPSPTGTGTPKNGRVLKTEIWYPTVRGSASSLTGNAKPATADGPFPVILFAHGFDTTPQTYAPLIEKWVRSGFVVVAPLFPDEQQDTVVAVDGEKSTVAGNAIEGDLGNEPADVAYVANQFKTLNAKGSSSPLAGIGDVSDLALAGQSDGATAVGALAYDSAFAPQLASLPSQPKAVLVLSGANLGGNTPTVATSSSPALLQVQSDSDTCQSPVNASDFFATVFPQAAPAKPDHFFMTLHDVSHLPPYTGGQDSALVEQVTSDFLKLELGWHSTGISAASLTAAGTSSGISSITSNPSGLPSITQLCTGLPTTPATPVP